MDQVDFEPAQQWKATRLEADEHPSAVKSEIGNLCKQPVLIRAGGGIYNYLYQLRSSSDEAGQPKFELSSILGKFQITWRTNLGEPGRLQTQNIHSTVSEVLASVLKILLLCSGTLLLLVTVTLSLILSSSFYAPSLLNCFHCI